MSMRLGVFGGTFDPIHLGHLVLAEWCREECRLDAVAFLPAGLPPHKRHLLISSADDRARMLELALADQPAFYVDRRELGRTDPCFTVDTLTELKREDPDRSLVFLMGADSLADFPDWREPGRILELAEVAAVGRTGTPAVNMQRFRDLWGDALVQRIRRVEIPRFDVSSREIRTRVKQRKSIRFMTPRAVEVFIESQKLYQ